jgi:Sphingolipid Delta4-desaturase (DES)
MAPSPNVPKEIGTFTLNNLSSHNIEPSSTDFSLLGGAETLSDPEPKKDPRRTEISHPQGIQNVYGSMPQDPSDFLWLMTEEPHRSRRRAIMKAHPEVSIDSPSVSFFRL